jgi:hypothetical protein
MRAEVYTKNTKSATLLGPRQQKKASVPQREKQKLLAQYYDDRKMIVTLFARRVAKTQILTTLYWP